MRSPANRKNQLFTAVLLSAFVACGVACGGEGSSGPTATKTPGAGGGGENGSTPTESVSGGGPGATSGGGGTTTTSLPDGGELQGAKLGSSSHTEIETKGSSGPKAGPGHAQEPGRRVTDIQAIVQARRDEARACYDKGLKDHPGIEGNLTLKWTIDPQGAVTDASIDPAKSSINEPSVGNCIVEFIKKVTFAPSKGGFETRANYPFDFHPKTFGKADAGT